MAETKEVVFAPADIFESANVRIDKMFWLPGAFGAGSSPDDFGEFLDEIDQIPADRIHSAMPWLKDALEAADDECLEGQELAEEIGGLMLRKKLGGFLLRVAVPVTSNHRPDGRGYTFSWGHYTTDWLYVPSLAEIAPACAAAAAEQLAEDKAVEAAKLVGNTDGR